MEAQAGTAIGLAAAAQLGMLVYLGKKIDALADRIDILFDDLEARIDSRGGRIDDHLRRHAS